MAAILFRPLQYIPRNMHTVFALLYFVVVIHWLVFSYPSGVLHWHCGNLTIAPVPAKQPWWIWLNTSCEFIMNDCITIKNKAEQNRVHISWDILYVLILPNSKVWIWYQPNHAFEFKTEDGILQPLSLSQNHRFTWTYLQSLEPHLWMNCLIT